MKLRLLPLAETVNLPFWRQPVFLLCLMAAAMPISFATWSALLNNFVIEAAGFTGVEIGWLHTVREIPGFLAIGVLVVLLVMREQVLALVSLLLLGVATAVTAWFPSFGGLLIVTLLSSIGFHYFETVNQSLQLQWIDKKRAPQVIGWIVAVGSGASLLAYGLIVLTWKLFDLAYNTVFLTAGLVTIAIALFAILAFPQFEAPHPQNKRMVLRRRYWLYYLMQFMSGARRQIFVVFAAFMMVERYGMDVHALTALFLINYLANMVIAPVIGKWIARFGERRMLVVEYAGLTAVFIAYGCLYVFEWDWHVAAALYVANHLFFSMAFAIKTYFQKIADPADIAPTAAVAFTINHIAAVFLPAGLGYLWVASPEAVFVLAAGMAFLSLLLSLLIPRHPDIGNETVFAARGLGHRQAA
ncbi:MFS transporter [Pseudorhodobacter sp. E13]|uniref:MFS transporter n=1 Tax=Pseudorhodobacter sp. E13 TaxID=2487931 RepID=UPI000F8E41C1|nr:MFS transporter [Pseudorhodobacter sp. E13]RUS63171.1 MFS transporter [Pseudorhodobacter sp. E13]